MKQRPLKMDAWGISYDEYKELYHFCQQYRAKKQAAADMLTMPCSIPRAVADASGRAEFLPHGGRTSNPVEAAAERREQLLNDVRMIERAATIADSELAPWILRAVTTRDGVALIDPPCGRRQFINARRKFFFVLSELKKGFLWDNKV